VRESLLIPTVSRRFCAQPSDAAGRTSFPVNAGDGALPRTGLHSLRSPEEERLAGETLRERPNASNRRVASFSGDEILAILEPCQQNARHAVPEILEIV